MTNNTSRRPVIVERANERRPNRPKPWSHQDELKALRGKRVCITFLDDDAEVYDLLEADPFALRLRRLDDQSTFIVWKHGVLSIVEMKS